MSIDPVAKGTRGINIGLPSCGPEQGGLTSICGLAELSFKPVLLVVSCASRRMNDSYEKDEDTYAIATIIGGGDSLVNRQHAFVRVNCEQPPNVFPEYLGSQSPRRLGSAPPPTLLFGRRSVWSDCEGAPSALV